MLEVISKKVLEIEYPRRNETITSDGYAFRVVATPGVKKVEVSINGAVWEPCRLSGDSFWYDWFCYGSGEYEVVARTRLSNGDFHISEQRLFSVNLKDDGRVQDGDERRTSSRRRAHPLQERHDRHNRMANKYVVVAPNRPDVLRQLTGLLSQEGVNIDSHLMEAFGDVVSFRFLLEKQSDLRPTLERAGFHAVVEKVFRIDLPNRPGELDQLTQKLLERGVAIRYLYGTSHGRTMKVVLAVDRPEEAVDIVKELDQDLAAVEA